MLSHLILTVTLRCWCNYSHLQMESLSICVFSEVRDLGLEYVTGLRSFCLQACCPFSLKKAECKDWLESILNARNILGRCHCSPMKKTGVKCMAHILIFWLDQGSPAHWR